MITVADARRLGRQTLADAGTDTPTLDTDLLLSHVLGWNRAMLLAHPERVLTPAEEDAFRSMIRRRAEREPLAYILGRKEFYGLEFEVGPQVLVPRPETELLVELALDYVWEHPAVLRAVDVGTGSGAVAIALATNAPKLQMMACDISTRAISLAQANARKHGVRIFFVVSDLLMPLSGPFNLILANLPYVARNDWDSLPPEVRRYEPTSALDGGADGLDLYRRFLPQARDRLAPGGLLAVEIGARQADAVLEMTRYFFPDAVVSLCQDLAGLPRVVSVRAPTI